jgi:D-arginine dehydrogenase
MRHADCVILGAGFAGLATAYQLLRRGLRDVVVLEKEAAPGFHASGRSAAMIRQVVPEERIAPLARAGREWIERVVADWDEPALFQRRGSLLLAGDTGSAELERQTAAALAAGLEVERIGRRDAVARCPLIDGAAFTTAVWVASDGTVDAAPFIGRVAERIQASGARILLAEAAVEIDAEPRGRGVRGVRTTRGAIASPRVVNAAGPWAEAVARAAGAMPVELRAYRRHLVHTGPAPGVDRRWPYVWDVEKGAYFRPDAGGLIACACDHTPWDAGDVGPDAALVPELEAKVRRVFPRLAPYRFPRAWAGLRTFAPDGDFVIGEDPQLAGFYWVAGLGGHGVTVSFAAGDLAARTVLEPSFDAAQPFSPRRFRG